jgi:hypothetical protein
MRGTAYRVAPDADLIGKIAARLDSPHDGEVLNAARMTVARLGNMGLKIGDVVRHGVFSASTPANANAAPAPVRPMRPHQRTIWEIRASGVHLTDWESRFITTIWEQRSPLSEKQEDILRDLHARARGVQE